MKALENRRWRGWGGWLGVAAVLLSPAGRAQTQPRLVCDDPVFDFAVVTNALEVSHRFVLSNAGGAELAVRDVRSGCSCAVAGASQFVLAPGASTGVEVRVRLEDWQGFQRKFVYVESNDPAVPRLGLEVRGCAVRDLEAWPREVSLGVMRVHEHVAREVRIGSPTGRRFRIEGVEADGGFLSAAAAGPVEGAYVITVTGQASSVAGPVIGRLVVRTDCPGAERLEVPVRGVVQGDVTVAPAELLLPQDAGLGAHVQRAILVRTRRGGELRVLGVTLPDPGMWADAQPLDRGSWRVQVGHLPLDGRLSGSNIVLRVDPGDGEAQDVAVPIRVFAAPAPVR
jgi:hypothetical protein